MFYKNSTLLWTETYIYNVIYVSALDWKKKTLKHLLKSLGNSTLILFKVTMSQDGDLNV